MRWEALQAVLASDSRVLVVRRLSLLRLQDGGSTTALLVALWDRFGLSRTYVAR